MAYKPKLFIYDSSNVYEKNEFFNKMISLKNSIDYNNFKRILLKNNEEKLLNSIIFYFPDYPKKIPSFKMLISLAEISSTEIPSCKLCGRKTIYDHENYNFRDYCTKCASNMFVEKRKKINSSTEEISLDFNYIDEFVKIEKSKLFFQQMYSKNVDQVKAVIYHTSFLPENVKFNQRLWHIINEKFEIIQCDYCKNKPVKFLDFNRGYSKTCCPKCSGLLNSEKTSKSCSITKRTNFFNQLTEIYQRKRLTVISEPNDFIYRGEVTVKCELCEKISIRNRGKGFFNVCEFCKFTAGSSYEREIAELLKNNNITFNYCDRKFMENGYELDFLIEDYNLAIEFDGLFWHSHFSENLELPSRHSDKTDSCIAKGIKLFHIFENEWIDKTKKEIWISMILNSLNKSKRIYARKCEIKEISTLDSKIFLKENHIQGYANSKIKMGLFYQNELVSCMTLGKPRYNKHYEFELIRFASLKNCSVIGGFSKLLNYFEKTYNPKSILSYANLRFSKGDVYQKNGFELKNKTNSNYFYFKLNDMFTLHSRLEFQKHKLKDKLEFFDCDLSESENMYNNGYRKIYDSGNLVYVKSFTEAVGSA